mmetsp:Transcript_7320/g.13811  ORF Transcript_7320/g.13811 Transcript_7320/m.13811 type:complete len:507 (+) Transcript_7320:136-1656(+)
MTTNKLAADFGKVELLLRATDRSAVDPPPSDDRRREGLPSLIPLRLPSALLSNLSKDSGLVINFSGLAGDGSKSTDRAPHFITVRSNEASEEAPREQHPLKIDNANRSDWYQSSEKSNARFFVDKNELVRIGETTNQFTVETSAVIDLKDIGKKTRQLLDNERRKRKEIVRLDDADIVPCSEKGKKKLSVSSEVGDLPSKKVPSTVSKGKKKILTKPKRKRKDPTVDDWMPDLDHLNMNAVSKDDHSNILRLHGLPSGVKPEHISKFFHGLSPSLIFVLPSLPSVIKDWDAKQDFDTNNGMAVKRHSSDFRVFVKFQSAPVANAAMERMGEPMGFDKDSNVCSKSEITGAAIALSSVPKHVANFLQKHMAIHARKGQALAQTMKHVEKQLGSVVDMLWAMATKKLKLSFILHTPRRLQNLQPLMEQNYVPSIKSDYERLIKLYNKLIDQHEKLELDSSILLTHTFDPSCLEDSTHRITHAVSNWILDEISLNGRLIKEARFNFDSC